MSESTGRRPSARPLIIALVAIAGLWVLAEIGSGETIAPSRATPARIVKHYALTSSQDSSMNDPSAWRLLGSDDGGHSWTVLDIRTNQQFTGRSQRRFYSITNNTAYQAYRLQIEASNSSELDLFYNTSVQIAELELLGPLVGASNEADLQYVISASDPHPLLGPAENAFDNDPTTRWVDLGLWHRKPCWIQCEYVYASQSLEVTNLKQVQALHRLVNANGPSLDTAPIIWSNLQSRTTMPLPALTGYALTSANDVPDRDPHDWRLLSSNDGGRTWVTLDERRDELFASRFQRRVFELKKPATARQFRLEITATRSPDAVIQLAEIEPLHSKREVSIPFSLVVSAYSDNPQVEAVDMAFDGDPKTKWLSFSQVSAEQPGWVQWDYVPAQEEQPVINRHAIDRFSDQLRLARLTAQTVHPAPTLKGYALTSANDHPERDPSHWRLLGSNDDGKSWQTLDSRQGELFPARFQRRVFMLAKEATFATYALEVDSVANPASANSVQLAQLEPIYARAGAGIGSVVVSVQGENPPKETALELFDGNAKTKWLDFADASTNRASWVRWSYALGQDLPVINLDRLKKAEAPVSRHYHLDLSAIVVGCDWSSKIVDLIDETGFQRLRLSSNQARLEAGERIRLSGQLRLQGQAPTLLDPVIVTSGHLSERSAVVEKDGSGNPAELFIATLKGRTTAVWEDRAFIGLGLELDNNGGEFVAKILNYGALPALPSLNSRLSVRGVIESVFNEHGKRTPGIVWVNGFKDIASAALPETRGAALPAAGELEAERQRQPLEQIHQVREFIRDHPSATCPVKLRGVITYIDIGVSDFYLCDGIESIQVSGQVGAGLSPFLQQEGMFVELTGLAHNGGVYATEFVHVLGPGQMPAPLRHPWPYLMAGKADDQWIEVEGIVTAVERQRLTLIVDGSQIVLWVNNLGKPAPGTFLGSQVRARGVCSPVLNNRNQRLGLRLLVPSSAFVQVIQAAPENPFDQPTLPLATLSNPGARSGGNSDHMVKTKGIVTYAEPCMFFLQEETNSLRVLSQQDAGLEAGDVAEVVGLIEPDGLSSKLVQALVRKLGRAQLPDARAIEWSGDDTRQQEEDADGLLVRADALLLGSAVKDAHQVLELRLDQTRRPAYAFVPTGAGVLSPLPPGSRVRLQGVFKASTAISADLEQSIASLEIYLNRPADLLVLARPPWWTLGRLAWVLLGVLAASAVVFGWGLMISRKNRLLHHAQSEMQVAHDRLERRVEERTHQLANSLSLLNAALESTADGILVVDPQGRISSYNRKFAQMWGVPADVLERKDDARLLALVTDQLKDGEAFMAKVRELYAAPEAVDFDTIEFKDGRVFERYSQAQRLADQCVGRVWCFRDITDRVRAEAELASERDLFKSLVDNLPDLIYFKDRQSRFVRVGKAMLQECFRLALVRHQALDTAGAADAGLPVYLQTLGQFSEYLKGKTDFDLYPEARARSAYQDEQEILRTGRPIIGKVERTALSNGQVTWLLTTKMLWHDRAGQVIGTFGTSKDITPIKEAEAKLETLHEQLVVASRHAGMAEVATSVLHNVGNVLNSVNVAATVILNLTRKSRGAQVTKLAALLEEHRNSLAEYLTDEGRAEQVIAFLKGLGEHLASEQAAVLKELQELSANIDHIKEIVSRQQSYAKVSGVLELHSVPSLLEDALRMHADSLARRGVQVLRQFEPVPDIVVDKHRILQILVNLVSNAKDALSDQTGELRRLTLGVGLNGDNRIRISVTDNGRGIDPDNLTRIFAHGFTTKKDGHGFGLHSAAISAREMGGSLQVHSDGADKGATFTLELPIPRNHPAD